MWIKKADEITQHIPEDGKWHDVQITNDSVYVDGELKNSPLGAISEVRMFARVLTKEGIKVLAYG